MWSIFTYISWLSELVISVSELAVLVEWAYLILQEMFTELGLILLFQSINIVSWLTVETIIVWLVCETSKDFSWWIVEIPWSTVSIKTFSLISSLFSRLRIRSLIYRWFSSRQNRSRLCLIWWLSRCHWGRRRWHLLGRFRCGIFFRFWSLFLDFSLRNLFGNLFGFNKFVGNLCVL